MRYKRYNYIKGIPYNAKCEKKQWELLRKGTRYREYGIENTIEAYERNCIKKRNYNEAAQIICQYLKSSTNLVSCGVGKGILEWHIKKINPTIKMCCTEYTSVALTKLEKVFIACDEFKVFDMKSDNWKELNKSDVVLLYRLETEFSMPEWKEIFRKMAETQIKCVIFAPSQVGGIGTFLKDIRVYISNYVNMGVGIKKKEGLVSWVYSEREYIKMWNSYYNLVSRRSYNGTVLYYLRLRLK